MTRKAEPKVNWRAYLTAEEDSFVRSAEVAKRNVAEAQRLFNKNFAQRYRKIRADGISRAATAKVSR